MKIQESVAKLKNDFSKAIDITPDKLDINVAFDLFVSIVIQEIFENKSSHSIKNLDLKKIIKMFEIYYGDRTQGSN